MQSASVGQTLKSRIGGGIPWQWLGLPVFTANGPGSIPGQGTKIPRATTWSKKKVAEGFKF